MLEKLLAKSPEKQLCHFSTEIADYTLNYGIHTAKTFFDETQEYDGIVLETGTGRYEQVGLPDLLMCTQYQDILAKTILLNEITNKNLSFFFTDVPPKKNRHGRTSFPHFINSARI